MLLTTTVAMTIAILKHLVIENMRLLLGGFVDRLQFDNMGLKKSGTQNFFRISIKFVGYGLV